MAKRNRRTKKSYAELYDNPQALFSNARVTLFPNGVNEIWIQSPDGSRGFRITANDGPCGLRMSVSRFACGPPMSVTGNLMPSGEPSQMVDFTEIEICQYKHDKHSQTFKRWYANPGTEPYPGIRTT